MPQRIVGTKLVKSRLRTSDDAAVIANVCLSIYIVIRDCDMHDENENGNENRFIISNTKLLFQS